MSDLANPALELQIVPRVRDLGGFTVHRVLPSSRRKMVGPFIFLDRMGPAIFESGQGLDVRPHPHIGLATVTYLFEGEILHRDSVGSVQPIRPGDVNWMTAGKGIAHSERTPAQLRGGGQHIWGVQLWVALPRAQEETAPGFAHHDATDLPIVEAEGVCTRVVVGSFLGAVSPVRALWETLLADVVLEDAATVPLSAHHDERAVFVVSGRVELEGQAFDAGPLLVLKPGVPTMVRALTPSRIVVLGGEPMDGPRHIWWNFVSSSQERIEQAKADWEAGRFVPVPDDMDRVPLPGL